MNATLTVSEVAHFLKLSESAVNSMVQRGEIPAERIGNALAFQVEVLENWLATHRKSVQSRMTSAPFPCADTLRFSDILDENHILMDVPSGDKHAIVQHLVEPLVRTGVMENPASFVKAVLAREEMMTTGIGREVAIPHPRQPMPYLVDRLAVVVGLSGKGVDFDAIDGRPVRVFFLIAAPNDLWHLWTMAAISGLIRHEALVEQLAGKTAPAEVVQVIRKTEHAKAPG